MPPATIKNPELELAWNFVEKTNRNIFLTGKAGTGKTTFLHKIKNESDKRLVVVAPTGVAAINAKGVTIHSFFQMPFGPILPEDASNQSQNPSSRFQKKFNRQKIDIIRSLDLLIIDEISMVRADLLDGIDQVLRRYRERDKVFGGVQILMIGDLQQLSPVVKPHEWDLLRDHYSNPYFFSSIAFQKCHAVGVELKHIYRQDDEKFIGILNEIRNNQLTQKSAEILNERHIPDFVPEKDAGYITLTTHNNRAELMNGMELRKIDKKSYFFTAEIKGNFPEHAYPTFEKLELKEGAQVMFIKNDSNPEKRYFNGKIGKIIAISSGELTVRCPDDDFDITVLPEIWENIKYSIDANTKEIDEDIVGSFEQIPLRLAWAITIHKSQGLTFEKAIIDAEASFAHGQTYVALSRCKTLEGVVLQKPIQNKSIINDSRVATFTKTVEENLPDQKELDESQKNYQLSLMEDLFNFQPLIYPVKRLISIYYNFESSLRGNIIEPLFAIKDQGILDLQKVSLGFKAQLQKLSQDIELPENDPVIQERIKKGIEYFLQYTQEHIQKPLEALNYSTENKAVKKDFKKQLKNLEDRFANRVFVLNGLKDGFTAKKYLKLRTQAVLQDVKPLKKREEFPPTEHPVLFDTLRKLRSRLALEEDVPPYQIFIQESLFEMCQFLPQSPTELRAINGMGKVRVAKYGLKIIALIMDYCEMNEIQPKENILELRKPKKKAPPKGATQQTSYELFKSGKTIEEIAKERGLVTSTIEGHLARFVKSGELSITDLMSESKYLELKKIMLEMEYESFTDLKSKIDDKFSYGEMRLVLSELEKTEK